MIGVIAEFSPFHNGHKYYLEKIRTNNPDAIIVVVISNEITQRGELAILSIESRAKIAIKYGADLVVELPFWRSNQAADYFAFGAVEILNTIGVNKIICGSESADLNRIRSLETNHNFQKNFGEQYGKLIMSQTEPNDILAHSYYRAIKTINPKISLELLKRKGDFHGENDLLDSYKSATQIRQMIHNNKFIGNDVPKETNEELGHNPIISIPNMFTILKHIINTSRIEQIESIMFVEQGIGKMLKERVNKYSSIESFENGINIKQYTKNKVRRMLISIYLNYTKSDNYILTNERDVVKIIDYNDRGQKSLKTLRDRIKFTNTPEKSKQIK